MKEHLHSHIFEICQNLTWAKILNRNVSTFCDSAWYILNENLCIYSIEYISLIYLNQTHQPASFGKFARDNKYKLTYLKQGLKKKLFCVLLDKSINWNYMGANTLVSIFSIKHVLYVPFVMCWFAKVISRRCSYFWCYLMIHLTQLKLLSILDNADITLYLYAYCSLMTITCTVHLYLISFKAISSIFTVFSWPQSRLLKSK